MSATALPAFDAFAGLVAPGRHYAMRIDVHEQLGDRTQEATLAFERLASGDVRLAIDAGPGAGTTLETSSSGSVIAYETGLPFLRRRYGPHDGDVLSLRGNGVRSADLAAFVACVREHRSKLTEELGPPIDGKATVALVFARTGIECPGDSPVDAAVTYDVLDVASTSAVPLVRKRYVGREIVEHARYRDFTER